MPLDEWADGTGTAKDEEPEPGPTPTEEAPTAGGRNTAFRRAAGGALVTLHIYDVFGLSAVKQVNNLVSLLGTGAFHSAVEVFGLEYSYGYRDDSPGCTGVFTCWPGQCELHSHRESIEMGRTSLLEDQVDSLLEKLREEWKGTEYDMLRHNCCSFSDEFCRQLGVGQIPSWVKNLAAAGATLGDGFKQIAKPIDAMHSAAIIAAAKAGEFDDKYGISGSILVPGKAILAALQSLDERLEEEMIEAGVRMPEDQEEEEAADGAGKSVASSSRVSKGRKVGFMRRFCCGLMCRGRSRPSATAATSV